VIEHQLATDPLDVLGHKHIEVWLEESDENGGTVGWCPATEEQFTLGDYDENGDGRYTLAYLDGEQHDMSTRRLVRWYRLRDGTKTKLKAMGRIRT
jgi:hypothetical protein